MTKPSKGKTTIPPGISREEFIRQELEARRKILAHFARTGPANGLVSQHRAKQRAEELVWRSIQEETGIGAELRAWDEAERAAHEHLDFVEGLDAQRDADERNATFEGWTDATGRSLLGKEFTPGYTEER